jgi:uncharacterized protein (DUF2249 family)
MLETSPIERVINVADIDPRHRHAILFRLFEHLAPDESLQIVVDHDPRRLRLQLQASHGSRCGERSHPGETFEDIKRRASFSKEDK